MKLKPPQEPRCSGHAWEAIKPLPETDLEYDFTFLVAWHDIWVAWRNRSKASLNWQRCAQRVRARPVGYEAALASTSSALASLPCC